MDSSHWNLATAFESVADALGDRTVLIQGDRRVSWRSYDERSARLAAAFTAAGLQPGSKVASYLYNCNEYSEGVYATFKMRGTSPKVPKTLPPMKAPKGVPASEPIPCAPMDP